MNEKTSSFPTILGCSFCSRLYSACRVVIFIIWILAQDSRVQYEMNVHNLAAAVERQMRRGTSQVAVPFFSLFFSPLSALQFLLHSRVITVFLLMQFALCMFFQLSASSGSLWVRTVPQEEPQRGFEGGGEAIPLPGWETLWSHTVHGPTHE